MAAHVEIRDRRECARIFRRLKNITNDVICAGNTRDVCNGDAGNPLTCLKKFPNGQQQRYLCGMASWGANCNQRNRSHFPNVFTNVAKFKGWVERSWCKVLNYMWRQYFWRWLYILIICTHFHFRYACRYFVVRMSSGLITPMAYN